MPIDIKDIPKGKLFADADQAEAAVRELFAHQKDTSDKGANMAQKVEVLETAMRTVQAENASLRRSASERDSDGPERHLRVYTVCDEGEVASAPRGAYIKSDAGVVRLHGHRTKAGGWRPGLLDDSAPKHASQLDLQRAVAERQLVRMHLPRRADGSPTPTPICDQMVADAFASMPGQVSRIFANSSSAASGDEFIVSNTIAELEREVQHMAGFSTVFDDRPMPDSGTMTLPYREGNLRPYLRAIPTANDPADDVLSDISTQANTITAASFVVASQIDRDAQEDSVIAIIPVLMMDMARAHAFGLDDVCINGDTGTHQDTALASWNTRSIWGATGLGTAADHRRAAIGLRARATDISNTTDQTAAETSTGFRTALKKLGAEYYAGMGTGKIVAAVSPEYFLGTMLGFSDVITWDKLGAGASIISGLLGASAGPLPGQVGSLFNAPVVVTPFITADLQTTGLFTTTGGTKTGMLVFDRSDFEVRTRKGVTVAQVVDERNNSVTVLSRTRRVFRTRANDTASSKKNVHWSFNLSA